MSWGPLSATASTYPNAVLVVMDGLDVTFGSDTLIRPGPPPNYDYTHKLITVRRVGGGPDEDDVTDNPVMQVACYSSSYLTSAAMQAQVQQAIMSWPLTEITLQADGSKVLVDEAEIYVGEQEIPDVYLDERRVVSTYRLGLRRQYRPT